MKPKFYLRRNLLSATILSLAVGLSSPAGAEIWQDVSDDSGAKHAKSRSMRAQTGALNKARRLNLNMPELVFTLNQAPGEHFGVSNTQIELPLPNGELRRYTLYHSPIMAKGLADQHPDIQTYSIVDSLNPENTGRLDLTPKGFHGIISHGGDTVYIDPIGTSGQYQSYFKSDFAAERARQNKSPMLCMAKDKETSGAKNLTSFSNTKEKFSFGTNLRTYRLAMAATGEFSQFHGGTKESTLAAIVTGINRVNQVFERDAAIKLELVANTSDVIYTDAATDPFTDDDADALINEVGPEIDAKIGAANYDIGHVFSTGGGGLAGFGVVCGNSKAEGVTGSPQPINDPFFIDFVAHEIGHQFSANHTFNSNLSSCEGNREASAAYEPGSGSTIMGYASLCEEEDIQTQADAYFHTHSLTQMSEFVSDTTLGGSCGVSTSLSNAAPVPNAGPDGHIPKSTPFILTGSATDANSADSLSYVWEQYDLGTETTGRAENVDDGSRPLFRSFPPKSSPSRTFPQPGDVLSGTSSFGEVLPTTDRDLNFRLTVRDGKGGVAAENMKLTVSSAAGPFIVTAPAAASWTGNSTQAITWDVANTTAAPISCDAVDITLSEDGGRTFETIIVSATPNDGSQSVTVPNVTTTTGRIRVKCSSQPFFAVNSGTISISGSTTPAPNAAPMANADIFTVAQDSSSTNLSVLVNDTDDDNDTLTVSGISAVSNGGTVSATGGQVSYQPAGGFSGTETFTYTVSDGNGGTDSAQVSVTVTPQTPANTAPVANDDSFTVDEDSSATNLAVLANDTDVDGDILSIAAISNISNGGTATINGISINYQAAAGFNGVETLTYTVSDGTDTSAAASVTITVIEAPTTPTPPPPAPIQTSSGGGGGGSFGLFMLLLLSAARKLKTIRIRRFPRKVAG